MSGPIFTKCARTARKRTIGALDFLRLSENLEEKLDNKLLWGTLLHDTTEKGRQSEENGDSRFCTDLAVGEVPLSTLCMRGLILCLASLPAVFVSRSSAQHKLILHHSLARCSTLAHSH